MAEHKSEVVTFESAANYQPEGVTGEGDIAREARERLVIGLDGMRYQTIDYRDDIRFLDGIGQWSEAAKTMRGTTRPMLTINKLPAFVDQATGQHRKNRIAVNVTATSEVGDDAMNTKAGKQMSRADAFNALLRDIEDQGNAQDCYDTAHETVVAGGMGYWQIRTQYVDDDTFDQRIGYERVLDPSLVVPDPMTKEADRSDMNWCFVMDWMARSEFDRRYPGAFPPGDLDTEWLTLWRNWLNQSDDLVAVAEYYRRVPVKKTIVALSNGAVIDKGEHEGFMDELLDAGLKVVQERKVRSYRVEWFRVGGTTVLEGPVEFPARWIPVVTVVGKELAVDGRIKARGIVRHAKDAQRSYNYWRTASTELAALQPKAPYIGAAEQLEDHLNEWAKSNENNAQVLLFNHIQGLQAPQRAQPPQPSLAFVQETLAADADIKATIGQGGATIGDPDTRKQSGIAIRELKDTSDTNTFTFTDNLARAIRHSSRIVVDMIPRVYDTRRVVRLLHEDQSEDFLELFAPITDEETGNEKLVNDLRGGRLGVTTKVGPSFNTQRTAAINAVFAFLERDPAAAPLVRDIVAGNLDFPGAKMMADRLRKTVPEELLAGERGDEDQEPRPPSAAEKIAAVEAEAKLATAESKLAAAEAQEAQQKVKLLEILKEAGLDRDALVELIGITVNDIIREQSESGDPSQGGGAPPPDVVPEGSGQLEPADG